MAYQSSPGQCLRAETGRDWPSLRVEITTFYSDNLTLPGKQHRVDSFLKTSAVTVSSNDQIVLPEEIRSRLHLKPGDKVRLHAEGNRIERVRIPTLEDLQRSLKGLDLEMEREPDRL